MIRLLLIVCAALVPLSVSADDKIVWGQPVNGLRIGVESPVASATPDQNLTFKVTAQNVSKEPITLPTPDTFLLKSNRSDGYHETPLSPVTTMTQMLLFTTEYAAFMSSDVGPTVESLSEHVVTLAPGQSVTWNDVPLGKDFYTGEHLPPSHKASVEKSILQPGNLYHVLFRFANDQAEVAKTAVWTGQADSGSFDLQMNAPSTAGFALKGDFTLPKTTYFIGEPMEATLTVTNQGTDTVAFPTGGDSRSTGRHERFSFIAVDEQGNRVLDPAEPSFGDEEVMGGGLGGDAQIKPGESYTEKVLVNLWCAFSKPGKYKVTGKRTLNMSHPVAGQSFLDREPETSLPAIPVETTLDVTIEDNPAAQADFIATLAPALLREDESSYEVSLQVESLARTQTPALFPELVKLLDASNIPMQMQMQDIDWLAFYGSEKTAPVLFEHWSKLKPENQREALVKLDEWNAPGVEPLMAAALRNDQDTEWRRISVQLCSSHQYASCLPILLAMGDDPDPLVRRYLGAALGACRDQKAIPVLLKLLHDSDPDPYIKIWAAEGLGKFKRMEGVAVMIDLLKDPNARKEEGNVMETLKHLTGQDFNENRNTYLAWWESTGRAQYETK